MVAGIGLATRLPRVTASGTTSTPSEVLPVEQYVAELSRKQMAAGVLFRDVHGRVLLVEPSYKPNWEIPGGARRRLQQAGLRNSDLSSGWRVATCGAAVWCLPVAR